jgi:hypothetical protein
MLSNALFEETPIAGARLTIPGALATSYLTPSQGLSSCRPDARNRRRQATITGLV